MKVFVALTALFAAVSASVLPAPYAHYAPGYVARVPSHDSAVIQSHRLGGNFAYRTDEAHAYASVNPVITPVTVPVAETYHTPITYVQPVNYEVTHRTAYPAVHHGYAGHLGYAGHHGYAGHLGYAAHHGYPVFHGHGYPAVAVVKPEEEAKEE